MYQITFDYPNLAKGAVFEVDGLGVFENGYVYEISDEQAETFRERNAVLNDVATDDQKSKGETQYELKPGPTVLQAFDGVEGVTVETESATDKKKRLAAEEKKREEEAAAAAAANNDDTKGGGE